MYPHSANKDLSSRTLFYSIIWKLLQPMECLLSNFERSVSLRQKTTISKGFSDKGTVFYSDRKKNYHQRDFIYRYMNKGEKIAKGE